MEVDFEPVQAEQLNDALQKLRESPGSSDLLDELGVEDAADLLLVEPDDLEHILTVSKMKQIPRRKLVALIKQLNCNTACGVSPYDKPPPYMMPPPPPPPDITKVDSGCAYNPEDDIPDPDARRAEDSQVAIQAARQRGFDRIMDEAASPTEVGHLETGVDEGVHDSSRTTERHSAGAQAGASWAEDQDSLLEPFESRMESQHLSPPLQRDTNLREREPLPRAPVIPQNDALIDPSTTCIQAECSICIDPNEASAYRSVPDSAGDTRHCPHFSSVFNCQGTAYVLGVSEKCCKCLEQCGSVWLYLSCFGLSRSKFRILTRVCALVPLFLGMGVMFLTHLLAPQKQA